MASTPVTNFRLDPVFKKAAQNHCKKLGIGFSEFTRQAIIEKMARDSANMNKSLLNPPAA